MAPKFLLNSSSPAEFAAAETARATVRPAEASNGSGVRKAMRKPAVLEATGWSNSTLYSKIAEGKFPMGKRIDPGGRAVVWFEDEIAAIQAAAIDNIEAKAA